MLEKYWIKCPICNGKTRVQVFYNTVLRNFPLFCPKCKLTHIICGQKDNSGIGTAFFYLPAEVKTVPIRQIYIQHN